MEEANNVVSLDQFRQQKKGVSPTRKTLPEKDSYYCTRCGCDRFKLYQQAAPSVLCSNCGAGMGNLDIVQKQNVLAANNAK